MDFQYLDAKKDVPASWDCTAELGKRQYCRDKVAMFSGHKIVVCCILYMFVVATPFRHPDLKICRIFFLSLFHFSKYSSLQQELHLPFKAPHYNKESLYPLMIHPVNNRRNQSFLSRLIITLAFKILHQKREFILLSRLIRAGHAPTYCFAPTPTHWNS